MTRSEGWAKFLKGKDTILCPDNDVSGRKYAATIAANLDVVAECIKVIYLPGLPFHGDVSDWLDAGGSKEKLLKLVADAPAYFEQVVPLPTAKTEMSSGWLEPINIFNEFSLGDAVWLADYCPSVISDFAFLLYRAERLGMGVDRIPNERAEDRFKSTIKRLYKCRMDAPQTIVRLSEEAQSVRESFEKLFDLAYHLPGNTPEFNAHLNKFPGLFCRLSLTYRMLTGFDHERPGMSLSVDGSTAEMAAKALIEYLNRLIDGNKPYTKRIRYSQLSSFFDFARNHIDPDSGIHTALLLTARFFSGMFHFKDICPFSETRLPSKTTTCTEKKRILRSSVIRKFCNLAKRLPRSI